MIGRQHWITKLKVYNGYKMTFDQTDSSNDDYPMLLSITVDGTIMVAQHIL